jgi:hypothetical protein
MVLAGISIAQISPALGQAAAKLQKASPQMKTVPGEGIGKNPLAPISQGDPELSELDEILRSWQQPLELHLCFAGQQELTTAQVAQGAAFTQAFALHAGYRPLLISHGPQLEQDKFNVLIGTVDQLRNFLSIEDANRIVKGYIAVQRARAQKSGYYLFVTGRTAEDVENAVLSLGFIRAPLPDSSSAFISEVTLPTPARFVRQEPLEAEEKVTFAQLEDQGATVEHLPQGGIALDLFFPGYLRTDSDAQTAVILHGRSSASFLIRLNGREIPPHGSTEISSTTAGSESAFLFPVRMFEHGRNVLEISSASSSLSGENAGEKEVSPDSKLSIPKIKKSPKLPDLHLISQTFYPFIGQPNGSDFAVYLADRDHGTVDSAWTLLARLAQSANTFFYGARLTFDKPELDRHVVVIGIYDHLPWPFRQIVALRAFQEEDLNLPLAEFDGLFSGTNLKQLLERLLNQRKEPAEVLNASARMNGLPPGKESDQNFGVMATARFPSARPNWSLVVTAFTSENLLHRVQNLVQPAFWYQIRGDIDTWKEDPASFRAHLPGEKPDSPRSVFVELPFGEKLDVWVWISLTASTLILCVVVTALILGKIERSLRFPQRRP